MMLDKGWVRLHRADPEYEKGAWNFVKTVTRNLGNPEMILCPCIDCRNVDHQHGSIVVEHLVTRGMEAKYKQRKDWYEHGEQTINGHKNEEVVNDEIYELFKAAQFLDQDCIKPTEFVNEDCVEPTEDIHDDDFIAKLEDAETPLYPNCSNYNRLSAIVALYRLKTQSGWSNKSFNELLETLPDMLPKDNVLHKSMYSVKKFLKTFEIGYEKIHACENDCCLFRKEYKDLDNCPKCGASRWKKNKRTNEIKRGVPVKVLRYFPIIPRLKRMFRSEKMAEDLRWHFNNKSNDGKMRHPVDSVTWDLVNDKWESFAVDPRNLRLGLSTDGFNPFSMLSSKYSCWPVMLVTYNLPPALCMKKENIMLTLLIPGPKQPGNDIDIYLQPLIEDLEHLWHNGVVAYDAFSRTTFNLKAILLWTISDFPAYGNLAGCCTKGKMACPLCGKNTHHRWLTHSRKFAYMGHRKFLSPTHSYRGKKAWFDNNVEHGRKPRILTGRNISVALRNFPNDFGKGSNKKRKRNDNADPYSDGEDNDDVNDDYDDQEELSRWKKRSIFFNLPYWEELPLRHNLDVMHVEKNVCESIIGTMLHCGKSKDGLNARKDLQDMQIRKDLHPQPRGRRTYLPPAPWTFSRSEKKRFCKRLYDFKGPDGYCSNIGKCVCLEEYKVIGLKSHDYHVLMQQLLPVALRGLLPKGPRKAILRLCAFFNKLCQRVIDREKIAILEEEIIETLCMLERFFPPSFFDIMVHLTVHLGREARLCGPVHFRWMYPFERYMKTLKDFVRNPARLEGCIAESYLAEECMRFCTEFLKKTIHMEEKQVRNDDFGNEVILEGRPISGATSITLSDREKKIAHLAVLMNTAVVDPYLDFLLLAYTWRSYKSQTNALEMMQPYFGIDILKNLQNG
ncbi:uncharacterized protein LOC112192328 isoform X2 [Rosa chinensis]|uniref:uncharacterized protein LOC112192328 isoform X2 n=1 Tax=Rosa chinensis TaxID=74649 RepID=UPI001AD930D8|nr:uncharacterized protein LOC112192328 isoform X2 [Rosa chinensis]